MTMSFARRRLRFGAGALGAGGGAGTLGYLLVVTGALTLDLGVGRRIIPLGPIRMSIAAPRETVFDVIAAPYLKRTPRAMQSKIEVLERGGDMVLAAHHTRLADRLTVTTLETIRFDRPALVSFRLVRGPVPHLTEVFELRGSGNECELEYRGELGTDLWRPGRWWGEQVRTPWERVLAESMVSITDEAERRAGVARSPGGMTLSRPPRAETDR